MTASTGLPHDLNESTSQGRRNRRATARVALIVSLVMALIGPLAAVPASSSTWDEMARLGAFSLPGAAKITWDGGALSRSGIEEVQVSSHPEIRTCAAAAFYGECIVTGLTNGKTYNFAVFLKSADSPFGGGTTLTGPLWTSNVTPCCSVPDAPGSVTAEPTAGAATVTWAPPANAAASGPSFTCTVSSVPAAGQCTTTAQACRVEGLQNGTAYTFHVVASSSQGVSSPGVSPSVTPIGPPGPPTGIQVFLEAKGTASVSWLGPSSTGGAPVTRYVAVAAPGGATCESTGLLTCKVTGLANGQRYQFSVTAYNQAGAGPASAPSGTARPLAGPGKVERPKVALSGTRATVTWAPPRSTGGLPITEYVVSSSPAGIRCRTKTTTCTMPGLSAGTRYVFTVQARNARGLGMITQTSAVTTARPAAPVPSTTPVSVAPADPKPAPTVS